MHTTDYVDTVITPAADTRATAASAPPAGKRTVAELQFERLFGHDYEWTSDELIGREETTVRSAMRASR